MIVKVFPGCEKLGLCGISMETALKSTDKAKMIEAFRQHGVSHPWYFVAENKKAFDQLKKKVRYPCIIKPTDSSGSRGVVLIKNEEELESSYEYTYSSSRNGAVIIEEYLAGPEVSVEVTCAPSGAQSSHVVLARPAGLAPLAAESS